ncbi:hypothetical protein [Actibacterium ureilyticum]|uniref:hypothetical protein n=1 Tax=Actibacterium ureilyticum TaxID=1590614 RepID=UPI000BAAB384|nr:hypothetical protein [Actibacterium ureilyticum]
MNAFDGLPGGNGGPPITLISIERKSYYLYDGEEHIDQLLLADGDFPTPVRCVHFESVIALRLMLGEDINLTSYWGIHPQIVDRLRADDQLLEIDSPQG